MALSAIAGLAMGCGGPSREVRGNARPAPAGEIDRTLFLIGDAGAPRGNPDPVLDALARDASGSPRTALIAFLGDNAYLDGLPRESDPERADAEARLEAQIQVARSTGVSTIFLPGNHDWARGGGDGWDAVRRMGRYLAEKGGGNVSMLPEGGCPGPAVVDVGEKLRLLLLDTQWWLQEGAKPRHPDSSCPEDSPEEVTAALGKGLRERGGREVVVLAHHPLASGGTHGGHFGLEHHLFPLRAANSWLWIPMPVLGSAYPLGRKAGVYVQDLSSGPYRKMREALETVFARDPPLVYAAGHEHNLQVLSSRLARLLLVSGGGCFDHSTRVEDLPETRFALRGSGYMRLDVLRSGRARLGVILVEGRGRVSEVFSLWLDAEVP